MTITFLNFGEKLGLFGKVLSGQATGTETFKAMKEANEASLTMMLGKQSAQGFSEIGKNVMTGQGQQYFQNTYAQTIKNLWQISPSTTTCYKAFPSQTVQKFLPGVVKNLDKSLLETGLGKGILTKLGGSASFASSGASTSATITGGAAAQIGGKALAKIPVLGIAISAAFEVPDIIDAFKNGDGAQQIGRSATNVACTTIGAAIGGAIGSLIPIPGVGTVLGSFVGGWLGSKVGKFLGNAIFGKSIKDKMKSGEMAQETMQKYNNMYMPAMNYNSGGSQTQAAANIDFQQGALFLNQLNQNIATLGM